MANMVTVSVYKINYNDLKTSELTSFYVGNVKFRPVNASTVVTAGPNNTRVYGIVQEVPRGLQVDGNQYYVIETVQQLAALAG